MIHYLVGAAFAALAALTTSAPAQGLPPEAAASSSAETLPQPGAPTAPAAAASCCTLRALTLVELEIVDPASSKTSSAGDKVRIRVAEPVLVDGVVAIPAGAEGHAEIIHASKARMMGKAGELTLGMPFVEVRGQRVPLKRMRYGRSSGHNANTEVWVATALIGIPGMLISGGNVDIQSGARAHAVVAAETRLAGPQ